MSCHFSAEICYVHTYSVFQKGSQEIQWNRIFYLSATISFVGGIVFAVFGSAERQSWADPDYNKSIRLKNSAEEGITSDAVLISASGESAAATVPAKSWWWPDIQSCGEICASVSLGPWPFLQMSPWMWTYQFVQGLWNKWSGLWIYVLCGSFWPGPRFCVFTVMDVMAAFILLLEWTRERHSVLGIWFAFLGICHCHIWALGWVTKVL